ncbi:MAG: TIGR02117 family protein [Variovorax sp.]
MLALVALAGSYVGVAAALMLWPANARAPAEPVHIEAYVLSNGVHTDLVFPVRSAAIDWRALFAPRDAKAPPPDAEFVAIGWGDRDFYLHTPTWTDFTLRRAVGALFGANASLLHVTWLTRAQLRQGVYAMPLSQRQYLELVAHVHDSLPGGRAVPLHRAGYGPDDAFYEATGSYHLLETCNTWTGRGLRRAGVPVSRWTPFDFNVVGQLRPAQPVE